MTGRESRSTADGRPPKRPPTQRLARQSPPIELTDPEKSELCLASKCSLRTIERWAAGEDVLANTHNRLTEAVAKRGIQIRARESKRRIVAGERAA